MQPRANSEMSLLESIWSVGEVLADSGELQGSSETEADYRWRARTTSRFGALPCGDQAIEGISQTTLERVCPQKRLSEPWCLPNHEVGWVLRLLGNFSLDSKAEKSTRSSPCSRGKRMCLTISQAAFLDDMASCCCREKSEGIELIGHPATFSQNHPVPWIFWWVRLEERLGIPFWKQI